MIRPMDARRYNEFCALATALDVVGERWTLLVVRELLLGPKRYSDLRDGLPGIASNLLATPPPNARAERPCSAASPSSARCLHRL